MANKKSKSRFKPSKSKNGKSRSSSTKRTNVWKANAAGKARKSTTSAKMKSHSSRSTNVKRAQKDSRTIIGIRKRKAVGNVVVKKTASRTISTKSTKLEKGNVETRKRKAKLSINIPSVEESRRVLSTISSNQVAVNYITKNISRRVLDVLNLLETPISDEEIAQTLDMKINAVRRILNIAQEYGITNYYVTKNTNGWLSFAWYINANKLPYFFDYINSNNEVKSVINDECNDYFVCKSCYEKDKIVFTFDAAFESGFKCACGNDFMRMDKEDARKLIYSDIEAESTSNQLPSAP